MIKQLVKENLLGFHQMLIVGLLLLAPFLGAKVAHIGSYSFVASLVSIALVYAIVDIINEVWGQTKAVTTITMAVIVRIILMLTMIPIALALPELHTTSGYTEMLHTVARVFIAGEIAVWLGNVIFDIPVFSWLKRKNIKGGFFIRTNLSNLLSSIISSVLFAVIAFWGVLPIGGIIKGQIVIRVALLLLISPFTTLWARWIKKYAGNN